MIVSITVSIILSFILLTFTYLKIHLFKPNLDKEKEYEHIVSSNIKESNIEEVKKLLGSRILFRKYEHETRAEILKCAAKNNYEIF